jgi:osmotically-inducible protein OsmY
VNDEPAQYTVARVRDALAHDERVAALDLSVRIVGHDVFLTGSVATADRRVAAEAVARAELPGYTVHNQLVLLEPKAPGGVEAVT